MGRKQLYCCINCKPSTIHQHAFILLFENNWIITITLDVHEISALDDE